MSKTLKDFEDGEGGYIHEGCTSDSAEELIAVGLFKWCGCGQPWTSLAYALAALQNIADLKDRLWEKQITWEQWNANEMALHGDSGRAYFFYYWADGLGLTEHGGSVPGWLTDYGREVLGLLHEWKAIADAEEAAGDDEPEEPQP